MRNRLLMLLIIGLMFPTLVTQADRTISPISPVSTVSPVQIFPVNLPKLNIPSLNTPSLNIPKNMPSLGKEPILRISLEDRQKKVYGKWQEEDLNAGSIFNDLSYQRKYAEFLETPEYFIDRNRLGLTKIMQDRKKRSFMLVFCMNKRTKDVPRLNRKFKVHIMWPGSKKRMKEQILVDEKQYPINVSVANYRDGYSPREWNIVLPSKKPKEFIVALMWSF